MPARSVLFVCLGNICRSPTAEGVFRRKVAELKSGEDFDIDSAGLGAWHIGNPPDQRAREAAATRDIDLSGLRARQVEQADFERFDYIIAMDHDNRRGLEQLGGSQHAGKIRMMLEFASIAGVEEVPDPYYGGDSGFDQVLDLIDTASDGLLREMLDTGGERN